MPVSRQGCAADREDEERKDKATFSLLLPPLTSRPPPAAAARVRRWQLPQHAAAAHRRSAQPGVARQCATWTGRAGWGTGERQGFPGSGASEQPSGKAGGDDVNGISASIGKLNGLFQIPVG